METINFRSGKHIMVAAILYVVGQLDAIGFDVSVSEIALFADVSKPTARKYLFEMCDAGNLLYEPQKYRPGIWRDTFKLSEKGKQLLVSNDSYRTNYYLVLETNKGIKIR